MTGEKIFLSDNRQDLNLDKVFAVVVKYGIFFVFLLAYLKVSIVIIFFDADISRDAIIITSFVSVSAVLQLISFISLETQRYINWFYAAPIRIYFMALSTYLIGSVYIVMFLWPMAIILNKVLIFPFFVWIFLSSSFIFLIKYLKKRR